MVSFLLKDCTDCKSLEDTLCHIDGVLAYYGRNSWDNLSYLSTKHIPKAKLRLLMYYKEILKGVMGNQCLYAPFIFTQIVSRAHALIAGEPVIPKRYVPTKFPLTTTTSTTTTTTTTGVPLVVVDNNAIIGNASITALTVDGVTPTGMSFPITAGASETGITTTLSLPTLILNCTGNAGSIIVIDSTSSVQCEDYIGAGNYTFILSSINGIENVSVTINDVGDSCS